MDNRKQYELYMKKVCDAFVSMQRDQVEHSIGPKGDNATCFYTVNWSGGLSYKFEVDANRYIKGIGLDEAKEYNANIAKKYLVENTLTFNEWLNKYS